MPTNNQILNALTLQSSMWTFDPNTTPANRGLFEDITDWSGIGIQSSNGDTVDIVSRITSPTGSGVYENAGYASSDFSSPDTDLSDLISPTYSLPLATGTSEPIFGVYQIAVKCKVATGVNNMSTFVSVQQMPSALPNNVLTKSTATSPPFSTIQFFVLGNIAALTMNKGDVYELVVDGDTISYTVPSSTQTVQQFYQQLNLAIIQYQIDNPASDWNNVGGSFGSSGNQFWLNLNRTDGATMNIGISYSAFGTPQILNAVYNVSPNGATPKVGNILYLTVYADTVSYTIQQGDSLQDALNGLYSELQTYITNNPLSDMATTATYTVGYNVIQATSLFGNTPFTISTNIVQSIQPITEIVEKTFNIELCDLRSTVVLSESYNCGNATYTSVDNTSYGKQGYSVILVEREHTVYPPQVSGQNDVSGDAQTLLLGAPDNQLWTGTYEAQLNSSVTYKSGNNYFYCYVDGNTELKVVCDNSLCTLFCYLKKLYGNYFENRGVNSTVANQWLAKWQLGSDIYAMIAKAQICAPNDVASLTAKFYEVTGFSEGCECGCDDSPAPVVPSTIINGENGTDGRTPEFRVTGTLFQWKYEDEATWTTIFDFASITGLNGSSFLQGSGVPSSGLGEDGDSYLDADSGDIYLKASGSWSVTGNISGSNGVALLHNDISNTTTSTNALETLKTFSMSAGQLSADGDMVQVYARFVTNAEIAGTLKEVFIYLDGSAILGWTLLGGTQTYCELDLTITRTSATAGKVVGSIKIGEVQFTIDFLDTQIFVPVSNVTATWANALDIETKADDNGGNAITNTVFQVTYFKKQ